MSPRLLITGASGFIGSHLRHALEARGLAYRTLKRDDTWPDKLATTLDLSAVDAVVHLANPRVSGTDSRDQLVRDTLVPLEGLIGAIKRTNPACCLVFLSSQSAGPDTPSSYGRLKWEAEQLLAASGCTWVVIRPGLVLGEGNRGLFSTLRRLIESSPVIPVIGSGEHLIQPVHVDAVTDAIIRVCLEPEKHAGALYQLALPPVPFKDLLQAMAQGLGKKRAFFPVPEALVNLGLWLGETVLENPPLTRVNLAGLVNLEVMQTGATLDRLGVQLPSLEETLTQALTTDPVREEAAYLTRAVFGCALDERTLERYREACRLLPASADADLSLRKIVSLGLDVEALELALRRTGSSLTKRIQILAYLLEFRADCFEKFVNTRTSRVEAFARLGFSTVRAPSKMIKGKYLAWRHGLV
ncbi:MAG: sugar nucleotide-binding protein [Archangium sp.]|nr:sugar nucleotide-binding protein [Archangium sp.]